MWNWYNTWTHSFIYFYIHKNTSIKKQENNMEEKTGRPVRSEHHLSLKGGGEACCKTSKKLIQQTYKTNRRDKKKKKKKKTVPERKNLIIIWDKVLFILTLELFYRLHTFNFFSSKYVNHLHIFFFTVKYNVIFENQLFAQSIAQFCRANFLMIQFPQFISDFDWEAVFIFLKFSLKKYSPNLWDKKNKKLKTVSVDLQTLCPLFAKLK